MIHDGEIYWYRNSLEEYVDEPKQKVRVISIERGVVKMLPVDGLKFRYANLWEFEQRAELVF